MDKETSCDPAPATVPLLSAVISAYMRHVSHRGQERILSAVERVARSHVWTAKTEDGFVMRLDRHDAVQSHILTHGFWDREVSEALKSTLKPSDVFYDVGANIGYFSLLAAHLGVRNIVAFEPLARLARRAEENVALNGFSDIVRVVPLGLGEARGAVQYQPGPDWNSGAGRVQATSKPGDGVTVELTTLDEFLIETGGPPATVMKIDVEGFEANVLRGASRLLAERPPRVIVFEGDCSPAGELEDRELSRILLNAGYRIQHLPRAQHESKENFMAVLQ
jgi:FkbM family methyltransferase